MDFTINLVPTNQLGPLYAKHNIVGYTKTNMKLNFTIKVLTFQ